MVILLYSEIINWVVINMPQECEGVHRECEGVRQGAKSVTNYSQALVAALFSNTLDNTDYFPE